MVRAPQNGGCSSGVERLTVAQEVAGSRPVTRPPHEGTRNKAQGLSTDPWTSPSPLGWQNTEHASNPLGSHPHARSSDRLRRAIVPRHPIPESRSAKSERGRAARTARKGVG